MDLLDHLAALDEDPRLTASREDQAMWMRWIKGEISSAALACWRLDRRVAEGYYVQHPEWARQDEATNRRDRAELAYEQNPTTDTRDLFATAQDYVTWLWWRRFDERNSS